LHVEDFQYELMYLLKRKGSWNQAVSLDLETKILKDGDFLTGEPVLAAGLAYRIGDEVRTKAIMLEDESKEAELALLEKLGHELHVANPLVILGYNMTGYDFPLLLLKIKQYDDWQKAQAPKGQKANFSRDYWHLKDALTRSIVFDVMHAARYRIGRHDNAPPKYLKLSDVIGHGMFCSLPLKKCKGITAADGAESKGEKIYRMWREKDTDLARYLEGDVHDTLLIAERIFNI